MDGWPIKTPLPLIIKLSLPPLAILVFSLFVKILIPGIT